MDVDYWEALDDPEGPEPMDEDQFWTMVDKADALARQEAREPHEMLELLLSREEPREALAFGKRFDGLCSAARGLLDGGATDSPTGCPAWSRAGAGPTRR